MQCSGEAGSVEPHASSALRQLRPALPWQRRPTLPRNGDMKPRGSVRPPETLRVQRKLISQRPLCDMTFGRRWHQRRRSGGFDGVA
ncbi:hypothetical protein SKAU_G00366520 [Synaphobranchus kaupii]|uniref:Uncharacterized protein n=1 Tax=Synaphobranchus kaupii TaxID=118154 RepID=A0A9Q1EF75_SYNKA|nr:hypothetical protein SKAU_G00366520 [Synaphobranchus kaupii]